MLFLEGLERSKKTIGPEGLSVSKEVVERNDVVVNRRRSGGPELSADARSVWADRLVNLLPQQAP